MEILAQVSQWEALFIRTSMVLLAVLVAALVIVDKHKQRRGQHHPLRNPVARQWQAESARSKELREAYAARRRLTPDQVAVENLIAEVQAQR